MKKLIVKVLSLRTFPAWLLFCALDVENKRKVNQDIDRLPEINTFTDAMNLDKNFRTIFYARVKTGLFKSIIKLILPPNKNIDFVAPPIWGGGTMLMHSMGMTVLARAIGQNCTIHQGVTIGVGKATKYGKIPEIGNNVMIGANAIVIGGIRIGDNVTIGAGAVVVNDVPDNKTIVGNPARCI